MGQLPRLDIKTLPGPKTVLRQELDNGITFLARENFSSPSVVISGYLRVGALLEDTHMAGLASMTAASLMRGTRQRKFGQIYETIESIGARLNFAAGKHSISFSAKGLAEDLGVLLDLLHEVLLTPTFPKAQVDRLRAEKLTALAIRDQETSARADLAFNQLIYGDHPYAIPTEGNKDTVAQLTAANARSFHRRYFGPDGMVICVVGGIKARQAAKAVSQRFTSWKGNGRVPDLSVPSVSPPKGLQQTHVDLEGKSQADLVMGIPGPPRSDPDFVAAALANNILGRFGMFGRIGEVVREQAGLAYYAYSTLVGGMGPGPWQVVAGVNPINLEKAIELIRGELGKIIQRPPDKDELDDNKANFIGRLPLQLESNEGVAGAIVNAERHSLGNDYYQKYPDLIASVTRDDILRVAQRFIDPDNLAIASAGPPAAAGKRMRSKRGRKKGAGAARKARVSQS
ncbi:MAG: M16 family metallopeptidase [Anaerolineales bacterium]